MIHLDEFPMKWHESVAGPTMLHLMAFCAMLSVVGCDTTHIEQSQDLMVLQQTDSVRGGATGRNDYCTIDLTVDAPVGGPKALVDSVMTFVNHEMYDFCEFCSHVDDETKSFSAKEAFTSKGDRLLSSYMRRYKPIIEDSLWNTYFSLSLLMESQTTSFVTYGQEHYHCGASCGSEKYYHTFDKKDGHRVREIISRESIAEFFNDYPEYQRLRGDIMLGWPDWEYSSHHVFESTDFGLGADSLLISISDVGNHFATLKIPYRQILSYLSQEAQALVEERGDMPTSSKNACFSDDGEVWMEVDSVHNALLGHTSTSGKVLTDTLVRYGPEMVIYPKQVHSVYTKDNNTLYLFIYSFGNILYCDEALICTIENNRLKQRPLFITDGQQDSLISCIWYDQLVEVSDGFPYDSLDDNRFGIHYDWYNRKLYVPVMEHHEKGSVFEYCHRYTGRFDVFHFDGKAFVADGTDGAWWLRPELRGYRRTVRSFKTAVGYEQIDLMPDGAFRHTVWKEAKTLDDLRKKPDSVKQCLRDDDCR